MRSILLIAVTIAVLGVGFGVYWWSQPALAPRGAKATREAEHVAGDTDPPRWGGAGPGSGAWVKQFDQQTGEPVLEFRASQYDPQDDRSVRVQQPEAKFYLADGQWLHVVARSGQIVVPDPAPPKPGRVVAAAPQAPSSGQMHDVRIELFNAPDAAAPVLTATMNNLVFDNDTFRIFTQGYRDPDGKTVAPDQVPIVVNGDEYDFEGRGLNIRWNERDRRLQMMEIAHGGRLVVKSPRTFSRPTMSGKSRPRAMLAAADRQAVGEAIAATSPADDGRVVYRATLHDAVRISQGGQELIRADRMFVHFDPQRREKSAKHPTTAPAAATRGANASAPPEPPIVILWAGKLELVPQPPTHDLAPGEAVVDLLGSPVVVRRDEAEIRCADISYRTADASLLLRSSPKHPLKLSDARGATVAGESMHYFPRDRLAELRGKSEARLPLEQGSEQFLTASWDEQCTLRFGEGERQMTIERAHLAGKVRVEHPQVQLRAGTLELAFEPPAADRQPELRQLKAAGEVSCVITDRQGGRQIVECAKLSLVSARSEQGKIYPKLVTAEQNVHAFDEQQDLRADHLALSLAPADESADAKQRPTAAVELRELLARGDVKVRTRDGGTASGQELIVEMQDGQPRATLVGTPAKVGDSQTTLAGPRIELSQKDQRAQIVGAGSLQAMQRTAPDQRPRPLEVSWSRSAMVDAPANLVEVMGSVKLSTRDVDGTVNAATAEKLRMTLADAPRGEPAVSRESSGATAGVAARGAQLLKQKLVREVSLEEQVEVRSVLSAPDGSLLRRTHLLAQSLVYDPQEQRLVVPVTGRLLYEDLRPPAPRDANEAAEAESRGATAFQWGEKLVYDGPRRHAVMSGRVAVVHRPQREGAQPFRLDADRLSAEFAPDPAADASRDDVPLLPKRIVAEGNLKFAARGLQFDAAAVEYDPQLHVLRANGTEREPAQLYDEQGLRKGSFRSLQWNTRTEQLKLHDFRVESRR